MAARIVVRAIEGVNGGAPVSLIGTGTRVNATAAAASTAEAAVPAAAAGNYCRVLTQGPIAIIFGATGVAAAAADNTSTFLPAGEHIFKLAATDTHFRVIRSIATDALLQLESLTSQ